MLILQPPPPFSLSIPRVPHCHPEGDWGTPPSCQFPLFVLFFAYASIVPPTAIRLPPSSFPQFLSAPMARTGSSLRHFGVFFKRLLPRSFCFHVGDNLLPSEPPNCGFSPLSCSLALADRFFIYRSSLLRYFSKRLLTPDRCRARDSSCFRGLLPQRPWSFWS